MRTEFDIDEFEWKRDDNWLVSHHEFVKNEICSKIRIHGRTKSIEYSFTRFLDESGLCEFYPMREEDTPGMPVVFMRFF